MSQERIALFMCAAHCQGGHSDAGRAAAEALGITFPITMKKLANRARKDGLDTKKLWPWYPIKAPDLLPTVTRPAPKAIPSLCSCKASQRDGQHMAWCPVVARPDGSSHG